MELALPVAVRFLQKGNKELSKNLVSYLSLAAIEYAYLLSPHIQTILDSIRSGNYGLCRVLHQIYEVTPDKVTPHATLLISLLPKCDLQEKLALLQLFASIGQKKPSVGGCEISIRGLAISYYTYFLFFQWTFRPLSYWYRNWMICWPIHQRFRQRCRCY